MNYNSSYRFGGEGEEERREGMTGGRGERNDDDAATGQERKIGRVSCNLRKIQDVRKLSWTKGPCKESLS